MSIGAMNWAMAVIERNDMSPSEQVVLLILAHRHNEKTGRCDPSYETISKTFRKSKRSTIYACASLEERGILEVVKRVSRGGQKTNQFDLNRGATSFTPKKANRGAKYSTPVKGRTGVQPASPNKEEYITNRAGVDVDLEKSANDGAPISHLRLVAGGAPC